VGTLAAAYRENSLAPAGYPEAMVRPALMPARGGRTPRPVIDSVGNTATNFSGPIAPGQAITILGENLGPEEAVRSEMDAGPIARGELAGTQVLFDGRPVRLLLASRNWR
jgi:hypothetical protein